MTKRGVFPNANIIILMCGDAHTFVQESTLSEELKLVEAVWNLGGESSVAGWVGVIFERGDGQGEKDVAGELEAREKIWQ